MPSTLSEHQQILTGFYFLIQRFTLVVCENCFYTVKVQLKFTVKTMLKNSLRQLLKTMNQNLMKNQNFLSFPHDAEAWGTDEG